MSARRDLAWAADVESPALLLDAVVLDRNIEEMASLAHASGLDLWPHLKSHKSEATSRRQLAAGARGMTCQTLAEAEIAVRAGASNVLLTRPLVSGPALGRLGRLAREVDVSAVVDSEVGVEALAGVALEAGVALGVLLEVDCEYRRCGVVPENAAALATMVESTPGLSLGGVMAYEGQTYDFTDLASAGDSARRTYDLLGEVAADLRANGLAAPRVSVGATAVADVAAAHPAITELRCGSYALRDRAQLTVGSTALDRCALTVLATVVSRPTAERFVVDAGAKALGFVTVTGADGYGLVLGVEGARLDRLSDEHGMGTVPAGTELAVGERVEILPNQHPSAVALADEFAVVGPHDSIERWPIDRRR